MTDTSGIIRSIDNGTGTFPIGSGMKSVIILFGLREQGDCKRLGTRNPKSYIGLNIREYFACI